MKRDIFNWIFFHEIQNCATATSTIFKQSSSTMSSYIFHFLSFLERVTLEISLYHIAQSAGAAEYTDCSSAEG